MKNDSSTAPFRHPQGTLSIALRYGALTFGLMLIYFLTINALGLQRSELARFGSHAFTVLGVFLAIRTYKRQARGPAPYLGGLGLGFLVGAVASALYAACIFIYANLLSPAYQAELSQQTYFDTPLGTGLLAASFVLLGIIIGSLTSYILMMANGTGAQADLAESQGE